MAAYYSSLRVRLHEKKKVKKINNLPTNFERSFYKNWAEEADSALGLDFQIKIVREEPPGDDVKNYRVSLVRRCNRT